MNLLGKILVILVFLMSFAFMCVAFMVYMTHTNWQTESQTAANQLRDAQTKNGQLQTEIQSLQTEYASERAARTTAIATLEGRARSGEQQLVDARQQVASLQSQLRTEIARFAGESTQLEEAEKKVATLRESVKMAEADRDRMFKEVLDLKSQVLAAEATRQRLEQREKNLLAVVTQQEAVLRAHGMDKDTDITKVAPPRDGLVLQVDSKNQNVLLSLGSATTGSGASITWTLFDEINTWGGSRLQRRATTPLLGEYWIISNRTR